MVKLTKTHFFCYDIWTNMFKCSLPSTFDRQGPRPSTYWVSHHQLCGRHPFFQSVFSTRTTWDSKLWTSSAS